MPMGNTVRRYEAWGKSVGAIVAFVVLSVVSPRLARAEAPVATSEEAVSYPRLAGGFRVPIGAAFGSLRGGIGLGLSARAGARLGSHFGLYGEIGGMGGVYGPGSGGAVGSMQAYGAVTASFHFTRVELSVGPAAGPYFPFPQDGGGVGARFGALARLTWIAVPARKPTGFHYAPSFEMMALGGPQGPKRSEATVAVTVSFIGFEWY